MTQPASQPDGPDSLNRRDLLRLGAASAGLPLIASVASPATAADRVDAGPTPAPAIEREGADRPEARARTIENLKHIGLALGGYAYANDGRFPPAAIRGDHGPLLSWRVAILPFLDVHRGARLYREFRLDEPWDSPHNEALLKKMPPQYEAVAGERHASYSTYYQGFVGGGALFDGEGGMRVADVTDGLGWTLMVAEAAEPVPWTKPADLSFDGAGPLPRLGGQFGDGFYAAFADGSARFLSRGVAPETIRALISRGDGQAITLDQIGPWRRPRQ
jgi:Protein of unknown function (DUF1559)